MTKNEIKVPDVRTGGVYALINTDSKKIYIGESEDIRSRAKAHINLLKAGKHTNSKLQYDYNNGEKFEFAVLIEIPGGCSTEKRLCAEDYYIECCRMRKIKLYNNESDKNTKDGFFILASRNDNALNGIIKEYKIHENRLLTNTR